MKRRLLFLIFIAVCMVCHAQQSLNPTAKSTIKPLTATDRKNYVMTIDPIAVLMKKYSLPKDNVYNRPVLFVSAKFTNNSNDTLRYLTMSCSWEDFYTTDNHEIAVIPGRNCDTNFLKDLTLQPHKSIKVTVPVVKIHGGKKFRIGMILIKIDKTPGSSDYLADKVLFLSNKNEYIIWSNLIELP